MCAFFFCSPQIKHIKTLELMTRPSNQILAIDYFSSHELRGLRVYGWQWCNIGQKKKHGNITVKRRPNENNWSIRFQQVDQKPVWMNCDIRIRDNSTPTQSIYRYIFSQWFGLLHLFLWYFLYWFKQNTKRSRIWFRTVFDDHDILWVTWEI